MIKLKSLISNLIIPLAVGGLSSVLIRDGIEFYNKNVKQPSFAPPSILFPIVWIILYILMGISSYIIVESDSVLREKSLVIYGLQLLFNFIWPLIFFDTRMYLFAFIWLILLWILTFLMIILFYKIEPVSAYLQIPYILWLTFAAILNINVYFLNAIMKI